MYAETPTAARVRDEETVRLQPSRGSDRRQWSAVLSDGLLTLHDPDGRSRITLPQDEAARYLHFSLDILHGHSVTFRVGRSSRIPAFRCRGNDLKRFLAWLPSKEEIEWRREIRGSALGVIIFSILHLVMPGNLPLYWAHLLLLVGVVGLIRPRRVMHGINGFALLLVGFRDLLPDYMPGLDASTVTPSEGLIQLAVGSMLLLWGVHQLSLLSPNHQLRLARVAGSKMVESLPRNSRILSWLRRLNLAAAGAFGAYAATLAAAALWPRQHGPLELTEPILVDAAGFGAVSIVLALSAVVFYIRKRSACKEAKASAQLVLLVVLLCLWSALLNAWRDVPPTVFASLMTGTGALLARPAVWVTVLLSVVVFNHWFSRAVDRELEEQRL